VSEPRGPYRISEDSRDVELERRRLAILGRVFDPPTQRLLERLGLRRGWRCLEVGAGGGSLARWLATRVAPGGSVLATDIDVRFQSDGLPGLEVRRHDIVEDALPEGAFDLVHARGVLQHVERREAALDRMVAAARPGGLVVIQDVDWLQFDHQEVPEPFASLSRRTRQHAEAQHGYDGAWGRRLVAALRARGLEGVECEGMVFTMHGGTDSAEWYVLALDRAAPALVAAGVLPEGLVAEAIAQARDPGFAILSPTRMAGWGRKPAS
jgi:SAM-dependent methyltransferase